MIYLSEDRDRPCLTRKVNNWLVRDENVNRGGTEYVRVAAKQPGILYARENILLNDFVREFNNIFNAL